LKIEQQTLDDHQVRLSVEVEAEQMDAARHKAARKIAQRVKVPGFRPGKAPYSVIEKQVGLEAIEDEALDIVIDDLYPKVLAESGVDPWGPGTLEKVDEEKKPRVFEFRVPLSPTVELGDYKKIRVALKKKSVTKKDVQGVIDNLREQQAVLKPVERAAQEGDMVYVQLHAERDKPDKDGESGLIQQRRYPVVVEGADVDESNEWPFPGFSRQLIGLKAGEEKELKHTFAKDSEFEDLRGEGATFNIKVEEIKDRVLPEVDDEFAKSVGDYENVAALEDEVKKSLTENYKVQARDEQENAVVDQIVEEATIKFPPQMVDHEVEHYIEDLEPQLAQQGLTIETYLRSRQMSLDELKAEVRPSVEERLKRSLVLMEVSKAENIEVGEEEVQKLVEERVQRLQALSSEEQMRKAMTPEALQGLVSRTMTEEIIGRTLARLRGIADPSQVEENAEEGEEKERAEAKSASKKSGEAKASKTGSAKKTEKKTTTSKKKD
jgi:trigger factor